jgi:hypothetical protein
MALREFLRLTQEQNYGVFNSTVTPNVNQMYIRLDDSNSFTMRKAPVLVRIPYGGGWAVPAYSFSDKLQLQGALRTSLYYSQANTLLNWGLGVIDSTQTHPWATTEPVGDLCSVSIEHGYFYDDTGQFKRTLYLGNKVASGRFEISAESQKGTLTLQLVGGKAQGNAFDGSVDPTVTSFPPPADAAYPAWDLITFTHSNGNFEIQNTITKYETLAIDWTNKLDSRFFAGNFVSEIRSLGRDINIEASIKLDQSPDLRSLYEQFIPIPAKVAFSNGVNTCLFDLLTNPILTRMEDDLTIDRIYFRTTTTSSQYDPANGTDFKFLFT